MRRSVIISTAILLVVTALCLTAATFSFFTSKSSNIEIDIDSLATNSFVFDIKPGEGKIYAEDASKVGEAIVSEGNIYCHIPYSTKQYYSNMFLTVKEFKLVKPDGKTVLERTDNTGNISNVPLNESDYVAQILEYQFVDATDAAGKELVNHETGVPLSTLTEDEKALLLPKPGLWKKEQGFTLSDDSLSIEDKRAKYFDIGELNGSQDNQVTGSVRFYIKVGPTIQNELIPGNLKDCTIQVVIQAKQL